MELELAELLVQVLEDECIEADLRESYSGRGMLSKTTAGVILREGTMADVLMAVINNASLFIADASLPITEAEDVFDLEERYIAKGFRTDSMGRGMIIY